MQCEGEMKLLQNLAVIGLSAVFPIFAVDADLLKYGGPDAKEIAGVYVSRVIASPLGLFAQSKLGQNNNQFAKFIADTGFDPRRDLVELVAFSQGGQGKKPGIVAARGRFDSALLGAAMATRGMKQASYSGVDIYERQGDTLIAFPEPGIVIAGDGAIVRAALDRRNKPSELDASVAAKINGAASRNDIWFVATGQGIKVGKMKLPDDSLEVVSGGLLLGSTVELTAEAVMKTEKDAQALAQVIQFMTAMGQMQGNRGSAPPFVTLLQNAKSSVQGTTVLFSVSAAQSDLEKLLSGPAKRASIQ
jgi:hypothetical protein